MSKQKKATAVARIPSDQRFSFKITPLPGRLMDLATIGNSMAGLADLHAALGKDINPDIEMRSYLLGAEVEADGSFRVDIAVLPLMRPSDDEQQDKT